MGEMDYQMALLLQHKFQQEQSHESLLFNVLDQEYARILQEQFDKENAVNKPSQDLVYTKKSVKDPTKSLTDPSWEVIDPTPDIHVLFMAFNERFFWNKLTAVCVSWSKRMTTCAGICSYQGRGGLCSITLSEPLLKLRPRKDLVETLLHEMIHAYLFVTNNNRDRDGHGPEFHSHMYRINREAGTNITVYHDFHEEVKLYQQHWWKCNGPCQHWKPYFGIVRRAMNRPPGPTDRWWGEHFRSCGGTFIKVKEPPKDESKGAKKSKSTTKNNTSDIRKYIPPTNPINSTPNRTLSKPTTSQSGQNIRSHANIRGFTNDGNGGLQVGTVITSKANNIAGLTSGGTKAATNTPSVATSFGKPMPNGTVSKPSTSQSGQNIRSQSTSNITGFSNNGQGGLKVGTVITSRVNNIAGFTNSGSKPTTKPPRRSSATGGLATVATTNRNGSFLIVTKGNAASTSTSGAKIGAVTNNIVGFSNDSGKKPSANLPITSHPASTSTTTDQNTDYSVVRNHWLNKFSNGAKKNASNTSNKRKSMDGIGSSGNVARNVPQDSNDKATVNCPVCNKKMFSINLNSHLDYCLDRDSKKECFICGMVVTGGDYEKHVNNCTDQNLSADDVFDFENEDKSVADKAAADVKTCGACNIAVPSSEYDSHVEQCLHKMFDNMEDAYRDKEETVSCLACYKKIKRSELAVHLEDCMNVSNIFDGMDEPMEGDNEERIYNCPCCMKLIHESEMSVHTTRCLNIVDGVPQGALRISLSSDDDSEI